MRWSDNWFLFVPLFSFLVAVILLYTPYVFVFVFAILTDHGAMNDTISISSGWEAGVLSDFGLFSLFCIFLWA